MFPFHNRGFFPKPKQFSFTQCWAWMKLWTKSSYRGMANLTLMLTFCLEKGKCLLGPGLLWSDHFWDQCKDGRKLMKCFSRTPTHKVSFIPGSPLAARSSAVVRSHIWMAPLLWPVKMNLRGREPMRLEPSHSWTQNEVTVVPSTALITQTLSDSNQCAYVTPTHTQVNNNSSMTPQSD